MKNIDQENEQDWEHWEDEEIEETIVGYECLGCGNFQEKQGFGYRCNRCYSACLDEVYY